MNIHYDQKNGIGSIPFNQDVIYRGFKCWMAPDMFLRLAKKIFIDLQDTSYLFLKNAIKHGKPIGSPYFDVSWDDTEKVWTIWGHEGRHRVSAIKDLWPNESIEVHIIPSEGIRARDITPPMIKVVDAAVNKAYGGTRKISWMEVYAGEDDGSDS